MKRSVMKRTKPMARGTPMKKRAPRNAANTAEKRYMGAVAALGCALCRHLGYGTTPAIVHHQRTGTGMMRASHYRTVPLCPRHHQSSGEGVHDMGREQFAALYGISEVELIEQTRAALAHLIQGE